MLRIFLCFFIALITTLCLIPVSFFISKKFKLIDFPDGKLKIHSTPTARSGGIAIYLGFIIALSLFFNINQETFLLLVGLTILFLTGLIDDFIKIKHYEKFLGQSVAAICFLKAGFYLKQEYLPNFINIITSFFWIVSIVNAFNLVDVMDGLASTIATCSAITFFIIAIILSNQVTLFLIAALLGSLIAFLIYNWPEAKIYMGDSGALFIGGLLSVISFIIPWSNINNLAFGLPIVILIIPVLEISTLVLVRTYKGIPFYNASPDHFSIYLQKNGWSKKSILAYIIAISIILTTVTIAFISNTISFYILVLTLAFLVLFWYTILLLKNSNFLFF